MGQCNNRPLPELELVNPLLFLGQAWQPNQNCWTLVQQFYNEAGIKLPNIQLDANSFKQVLLQLQNPENYKRWVKTEKPNYGDIVIMRQGKHPSHVGIYLHAGKVLHTLQKQGTIISAPHTLTITGYIPYGYWTYNEHYYRS